MRVRKNTRSGNLVQNGVTLEPHESNTVLFLLEVGCDIELIPKTHTPRVKSPDFCMDGLAWEMKSPVVNSAKATERSFYKAVRQSENVMFDLRRLKGDDTIVYRTLVKCYSTTRRAKNMYIITKTGQLMKYKK